MVGGHHILRHRRARPLAIALSEVRRGLRGKGGYSDVTNVQYKPVWN
jgi:hypothetical protein